MTPDLPLSPHELILWQGRPDSRPFVTAAQFATIIQGVIALLLFLYLVARLQMGIPPLWDVRLIVLFIVFKTVPIEIVASVLTRRNTHYTLTRGRAIIVTTSHLFGQSIRSYPIRPDTPLDFQRGKQLSSLFFAKPRTGWLNWLRPNPAPGFERIADGAKVFALISQLQGAP